MYFVLLTFRAIRLLLNQLASLFSSMPTLVSRVCRSESESSLVVSSAYSTEKISVARGRSFMKHDVHGRQPEGYPAQP